VLARRGRGGAAQLGRCGGVPRTLGAGRSGAAAGDGEVVSERAETALVPLPLAPPVLALLVAVRVRVKTNIGTEGAIAGMSGALAAASDRDAPAPTPLPPLPPASPKLLSAPAGAAAVVAGRTIMQSSGIVPTAGASSSSAGVGGPRRRRCAGEGVTARTKGRARAALEGRRAERARRGVVRAGKGEAERWRVAERGRVVGPASGLCML